jgi:hypothetical protein
VEHRHYPRIQVSLDVDLFKHGNHIGSTTTKDISLGGMMLQNDDPSLNLNDAILLRMSMQGEERAVSGFVTHSSQNIAGIMVTGMSRDTTRAYYKLLRDMDSL